MHILRFRSGPAAYCLWLLINCEFILIYYLFYVKPVKKKPSRLLKGLHTHERDNLANASPRVASCVGAAQAPNLWWYTAFSFSATTPRNALTSCASIEHRFMISSSSATTHPRPVAIFNSVLPRAVATRIDLM